jgi:glutamate-1-semialdehyde 2,1-aminomutase
MLKQSATMRETMQERAHRLIPAGCHTFSKGDDQFPECAPSFIVRGKGARVWDSEGREYVDWGMGLRSVILGHCNEEVLAAVRRQLELGSNFVRPSPVESDLAELLVETIPCAEMCKFAKNGSDVTTASVKLARAYAGRDLVVRCEEHPFFSVDDWFIGDTPCDAGVPAAIQELTKRFSFNDLASLKKAFEQHPGRIACVIMEPATAVEPRGNFLPDVLELCRREGSLLIFDEMITGFRWHAHGAQAYYGVKPDLATFGKAMGNGFSCSALVGKREIMQLGGLGHDKPRVFLLSTTHGGETHAIAAAIATIQTIKNHAVIEHVWKIGGQLQEGFNRLAAELGISEWVKATGVPCSPCLVFRDRNGKDSASLRTLYLQETIRQGVLIPYVAPSFAHGSSELDQTLEASRRALQVVARALEAGTTEGLLVGSATKPVFRRFN